jgi:hypothetical protein
MSLNNPSSLNFPSPEAKQPEERTDKKKHTNPLKAIVAGTLVLVGGAAVGAVAQQSGHNAENGGKEKTTQTTPPGKSHERLGMQSMGAPVVSSESSGDLNVDSLLTKTESSGASLSVKKKDLTKTGYIADTDTQIKGKSFQTGEGSYAKVEQKFKQWKKNNPQSKVTQVSFNK